MRYNVSIEGGSLGDTEIVAESDEDAEIDASAWTQEGEWPGVQSYVTVQIERLDDEGEVDREWSIEVAVGDEEEEPDCIDDEHDWRSPEWLGGCRENPGVWSVGGTQISSVTVCSRCGVYRDYTSESTPGQYPITPERTSYREADEASRAFAEVVE